MEGQLFSTCVYAGKKNHTILLATPKKVTCYKVPRPDTTKIGPYSGEK